MGYSRSPLPKENPSWELEVVLWFFRAMILGGTSGDRMDDRESDVEGNHS